MTDQGNGAPRPPDDQITPADQPPSEPTASPGQGTSAWEPASVGQPAAAPPPPPAWTAPPPSYAPPPSQASAQGIDRRGVIAIGVALILLGGFFLVVQLGGQDFADVGWPLFIVIPGVILYVVGFIVGGRNGSGFTIAGSIVTMVGIVLAVQNTTDLWASWAYAWALVGPGAAGFGMLTYGLVNRFDDLIRGGLSSLGVGIALFIVGFFFFEGVLGLSGDAVPEVGDAFPLASIGLGAILVVLSLFTGQSRRAAA